MRKKIILATISLHQMAGGLEKNFVRVANHYAQMGHDVHLVTFDLCGAISFFEIDPRITWHCIAHTRPHTPVTFWQRLTLILRMRSIVRVLGAKTQVIIFHHGILSRWMAACWGLRVTLYCSERNALSLYDHVQKRRFDLNFQMLRFMRRISVQFPRYVSDYPRQWHGKIRVIPNIIEPVDRSASVDQPDIDGGFTLLAVGRLCAQKNYDCLIDAFGKIAPQHPTWTLKIVGEGELEHNLKQQVLDLGLEKSVVFLGKTKDMHSIYQSAHLFVMPSKWEGFPNALAEAMVHGLPCVGFDECAGVSDLIVPNETGLLARGMRNPDTLMRTLDTLMSDPIMRVRLGNRARKSVAQYDATSIYKKWDAFLED